MAFKIFMLIVAVSVPLMMAAVGRVFMKSAPKTINPVFGYRTTRSMKNEETWTFAHAYCGRIWFVCGLVFAGLAVALMVFSFEKDRNSFAALGAALCFLSVVGMIWSVVLTERTLKEVFDENGERRPVAPPEEAPTEGIPAPETEDTLSASETDEEAFFGTVAPEDPAPQTPSVSEDWNDDVFGD